MPIVKTPQLAVDVDRIDQQSRACLKLWASVIVVAIQDACIQPYRAEGHRLIVNGDARTAMKFLLEEDAIVSLLDFMDINAGAWRKHLVRQMYREDRSNIVGVAINNSDRRTFRLNYKLMYGNFGGFE